MKKSELTKADEAVLGLLRSALGGESVDDGLLDGLTAEDWRRVAGQSARQGVSAIVFDALSSVPAAATMPKPLALKWMAGTAAVENRYAHQKEVGAEVAELLAAEGISVPVLKGLALATYYPRHEHRECGDIDIYSGERHLTVDSVLAKAGAEVKDDYYIHSHILYKGVTIENHRFFGQARGSRSRKKLEKRLGELMNAGSATVGYVPGTGLLIPPADFTALFFTMHALKHFIGEGGVRLRHLADWAMFLKAEQENVDWAQFRFWAERMHLSRFADAMTALAVNCLGLEVTAAGLTSESRYADLVLADMLHPSEPSLRGGESLLRVRLNLVRCAFRSLWKYHRIYRKSALLHTAGLGLGLLFERTPKL